MLRYIETLGVLVGFAVFVAALLGDGRDGPIIGGLIGLALIEMPAWLPCVLARLAKLQRRAHDVLDDFGL